MNDQIILILDEYEVNRVTTAVLPTIYNKKLCARVLEIKQEYVVSMSPTDIIEKSCRYYGSTLDGRTKGTQAVTGITHKAPIAIDPYNMIYFFPTHSPKQSECAWISHRYVENHGKINNTKINVTFINKKTIQLPISNSTFENQLYRTAHLRVKLLQRLKMDQE
jgi:competence protein ComK